jgi:hypothetical protein
MYERVICMTGSDLCCEFEEVHNLSELKCFSRTLSPVAETDQLIFSVHKGQDRQSSPNFLSSKMDVVIELKERSIFVTTSLLDSRLRRVELMHR